MVYSCAAWAAVLALSGLVTPTCGSPQDTATQSFEGSKIAKLPMQMLPASKALSKNVAVTHSCVISCNDYKIHEEGSKHSHKGGSCLGKLKAKCEIADNYIFPNYTLTYSCDGAFKFMPIDHDDKVSASVLSCEGAMFTMNEVYSETCAGGKCYSGVFCLSNSAIISADTEGYAESAVYCNQASAYGDAQKVGSDTSDGPGRKGRWNNDDDAHIAQLLQESLTGGMWMESLTDSDEIMEDGVIQDIEDVAETDTPSIISRASALSLLQRQRLTAVDKSAITLTCNGRKIHKWFSWWPCWGHTKFEGKFSDGAGSLKIAFECHGLSVPSWMVCKGLSTLHTNSNGEYDGKEVRFESMEVASGKKRFENRKRGPWQLHLTFSKGPNSAHTRIMWPESDPGDDVKETVAAIMSSAADAHAVH